MSESKSSDVKTQWAARVLGVQVGVRGTFADGTTSGLYAAFRFPTEAPLQPEDANSVSKTLPDNLKAATKSNLAKILELKSEWEEGVDGQNYKLYMSQVEDPSADLEDLYNDTSKILKKLTGKKDSAPALEEYYQYPGLTKKQIGAVKWTKERYGGVQACRKAGEFVEEDRKASIEQLLKGEEDSDRSKLLDALAEAPAEPVALWEQARMRALLELRFGIKFSGDSPLDTGHQKGLDRLYRVLKDVPTKHLKLLQEKGGIKLDYADEGFRGDYVRKTKTVAIAMPLSDHKEVQRPNSAGEAATVQWFKQVATHEVGHAVDDADEYMSKHQNEADHGAWEKSDIHTAVAAYAAALQKQLGAEISKIGVGDGSTVYDLQKFIAYSILRSPLAENEIHANSEAARKTAAEFSKAVSQLGLKAKFWNKGLSAAQTVATLLGGTRVHFEAYKDQWWSFDVTERKNAVTDYQWRSPAEWFAEPYALYFQGKLNAAHPVAKYCEAAKSS